MAQANYRTDSKAFIVYKDWEGLFALLSDRTAGALIKALFAYASGGGIPKFSGAAKVAFFVMAKQLDRDGEKWEQICAHRSEAGKKGGRPRKQPAAGTGQTPPAAEAAAAEPAGEGPVPDESICFDECAGEAPDPVCAPDDIPAPPAQKAFAPPAVQEVAAYCSARTNRIDAQAFVDYYTANGWMVGRSPMRDWRAAVRRWEQNGIRPQRPPAPDSIDMRDIEALVNSFSEK